MTRVRRETRFIDLVVSVLCDWPERLALVLVLRDFNIINTTIYRLLMQSAKKTSKQTNKHVSTSHV